MKKLLLFTTLFFCFINAGLFSQSNLNSLKIGNVNSTPTLNLNGDFRLLNTLSQDEIKEQTLFYAGDSLSGFDYSLFLEEAEKEKITVMLELQNFMHRKQSDFVKKKFNLKKLPFEISKEDFYKNRTSNITQKVAASACNNLDFEDGNLGLWVCSRGYNTNSNAALTVPAAGVGTAILNTNQTIYGCSDVNLITSAYGADPIGFPGLDPNGASFSARLGGFAANKSSKYGTCGAAYYFSAIYANGEEISNTIAVTAANSLLSFDYAVVLNDGGHTAGNQPYFHAIVTNTSGVVLATCTEYFVQAAAGGPPAGFSNSGFVNTADNSIVYYKNWTSNSINLTPYIGQSVIVKFSAAGCTAGLHYSRAYVDAICGAAAILSSNAAPCPGNNVTLTAPTVAGGTYNWFGTGVTGLTTQTVGITSGGNYTVVVTPSQGAGCTYTLTKTITYGTAPSVSVTPPSTLTCSTPTINAIISSTVSPVSYAWTGTGITSGSATNTISVNLPGTFNYTVTNTSNGCKTTGSQIVTQNTLTPSVIGANTGSLNCLTTTIDASSSTTMTPVSYTWSGTGISSGNGTGTVTVNQGGSFNYTVTNTNSGCQTTGLVSVTQNTTPPSPSASTTGTLTCSASSQTVNLNGGPGAGVTYTWSGAGVTSGVNSQNAIANAAGVYTLTITNNSNKCINTATTSVPQNTAVPAATSGASGVLNCSVSLINVSATTTVSPASYTWTGTGISSGAGTGTISVNQPGTFNYTVMNSSNGCKSTGSQAVTQNTTAPLVSVSSNTTITCAAPTVTITGSATPSTCTPVWTGGVSSGATSYTASASSANVYTLTVTDPSNGCSASKSLTVSPSAGLPILSSPIVSNSITCSLSTAQVTLSSSPAGNTYSWSGAGITSGATTSVIAVNAGGTYSAVVTNTASSCSSSVTAFVPTNTTLPLPAASTTGTLTCAANSQTVSLNGNALSNTTYTWSGPGVASGINNQNAIANTAGIYTLAVTNTVNSCSKTSTTTVVQNTLTPSVAAAPSGSLNCTTFTVNVTATTTMTPVSYTWTGTGITSVANNSVITVNQGGTFSYTVTNTSNSCVTSNTVAVIQNTTAPIVAGANTGSLNCTVSSINVSATTTTSPVSFNWSGTGITSTTNISTITVNQGGAYAYTVTNTSNNCTTTNTVAVIQNTTSPSVVGANTGSLNCTVLSINASATTTSTPLSFSWSGTGIISAANISTITVNQGGTFTYTVTNTSNNCIAINTVSVVQNTIVPVVTIATTGSLNCQVLTESISASTTITPVSYNWSGPSIISGAGTNNISVDQGGIYSYTVTNTGNNCRTTNTVAIIQNTIAPTASASPSGSLNCTTALINVIATSTTTPISYSWSGPGIISGATTGTISVNTSGTYTYVTTNSDNYCNVTNTVLVIQNTTPPAVAGTNTGSLNCTVLSINASATTSTTPVSYNWSGTGITAGAGTGTITVNQGGTFNYTVTNTSNNCTTINTVAVVQNTTSPSVSGANTGSLNCTALSVNASATTSTTPVSYNWSGAGITAGATTGTITVNQGGTFNYTVTNTFNNCTTTNSIAIIQNTTSPTVTGANTGSLNCTVLSVNASATTTSTPVSYNWSGTGITAGATTGTITVNQGGTFNYTVTNTFNNCTTSNSIAIIQNTISPSVTGANTGSLNCTVLSVNASATTTTTPVSYNWSGTGITSATNISTITVNQGGTFNYTVTNTTTNCKTSNSVTVIQNTVSPTVVSANTGSINCSVLSVNASATTSTTPVSYNWSGPGITAGAGTGTITVNQGGTYNYTVINTANTCSTTGSQAITQSTTAPSVAGANTGSLNCTVLSVNASATTSSTPVAYNWSGPGITAGSGTGTITVNQGGTYNYTVTNTANTCSTTGSQAITQSTTAPSVAGANTGSLNCTVLSVNASATTSTTPVSYVWSGLGITAGSGTGTITVNQAGTYNYTVTNTANTCSTTGSQAITQSTVIPSVAGANTGSLNCTVLSVNASATTSTTPVSYNWSGPGITAGSGTGTITVNQGGTYNYTVTNTANTCSTTGSQAITQNTTAPTTTASTTGSITCVTNTINLNSTLPSMNYTWTAPGGSSVISGASLQNAVGQGLGTYTLTVLNSVNSCTFQTSVAAIQNVTTPSTVTAGPNKVLVCVTPTLTLDGSASPGATANWLGGVSSPNSFTTTTGAAGVYTLQAIEPTTGCFITSTVAVTQSTSNPVVNANPVTNSITCTNSVVAVGVTVTSTASVTYAWPTGTGISGPTNAATTTATLSGVYQVTVTNNPGNGCVSINPISVSQNTTPVTVGTTPASSITCLNPTETLNITPAGANYTYTWTGSGIVSGGSTTNPVVNTGGNYSVTVTNTVNGCTGNGVINVPMNISTPTVTIASPTVPTTCGNPTVTINATSNPATGVTYSWTAPGSGSLNSSTISNPVASGSGIFTVVVTTTVNGCSSSLTQNTVNVIPDVAIPIVSASPNSLTITCTNTNVTTAITSNTAISAYSWSPNPLTGGANPVFDTPATYIGTLTASNGCKANVSVNVSLNNTVPSVTLTSSGSNTGTLTCLTTSIVLTPTVNPSNSTYTWTSALSGVVANTSSISITAPDSYTLTVTDAVNGCTTSATNPANVFTVDQTIGTPTITLTSTGVNTGTLSCLTTAIVLTPTVNPANSTYTWTSGLSGVVANTSSISITAPDSYTLTVTDAVTGCTTSATNPANVFTVYQAAGTPTITLTSTGVNTGTLTCLTTSIVLTPTVNPANSTYTWTSGLSGVVANTASISITAPDSYTLTVTDAVTGCTTSATNPANIFTVYQNTTTPTVTLTTAAANEGTLTCLTTSIVVTPTVIPASASYTWSSSAGTFTNTSNATFTAPGAYTLTVKDAVTGCVTSSTNPANIFTVYQNTTTPTVTLTTAAANNGTLTCLTTSIVVTPTVMPSSATYTWSSSAGTFTNTSNATFTAQGVYTLTVMDAVSGCVTSSTNTANTYTVYQNTTVPTMTLTTAAANNGTLTCLTTSIVITPTIIPSSATYTWSSSAGTFTNTSNATFTAPNVYTLTVMDAVSGCTASTTNPANVFTVYQNTTTPTMTLTTSAANDGTLTCLTTSIVITPTIIPSSATYTWSSSAGTFTNTSNATFTSPGLYTLTVMDAVSGCTTLASNPANIFTVYQNIVPPTATITAISINSTIGCGGSSSTVTLSAVPTLTNIVYSWLPGMQTTPTLNVTSAGIYTLLALDPANSCSTSATYTITGNSTPPQNVNAGTLVSIPCGNLTVALNGTTTSTNINYAWSGPSVTSIASGSNTANPVVNTAGNYTLTVTDNLTSCTSTAAVNVSQGNVTAIISADPIEGLSPLPVSFTCTSIGATNYSWNFGDGNTSSTQNPINTFTTSGTYTVVLTASSGPCTATATITIIVNDGLTLEIPNVFTPNNDGSNDFFTIKSTGIKEISLQIFNRWGQTLYEFSGPKASWDGLVPNGSVAPEGTYFYFVKATGFDGKVIEKNGTMNLFR